MGVGSSFAGLLFTEVEGMEGKIFSSSSSSSNSPSSSAVASWYCWYSETKSFMLDSASVNSISSIPSPVYQWRKAFLLNMAVNCSETRLKSSWMAVELPMKVADIFKPRGGISQTAVLTLFGIHSTKYVEHLFVNLLHGHTSTEHGGDGEVSAVTWITSGHHVLGIEHLLGEFWNCKSSVLLGTSGGRWGESGHEKVETGEGDHINSQLSQIGIQLTGESETGGHTRHGSRYQMVQITIGWGGQFKGTEADVVEGFVIDAVGLVGVLNELMDGEGGVVGFDNGIRYLWRWYNREGVHDSVGVFLTDLRDKECTHTGTGTTTERVGKLESLKTITGFSFLADNIEDRVY